MSLSLFTTTLNPFSWFSGTPIAGSGFTSPVTTRTQMRRYQDMVAMDLGIEDSKSIMNSPVNTRDELEKWQAAYARERLLEEAREKVVEKMRNSRSGKGKTRKQSEKPPMRFEARRHSKLLEKSGTYSDDRGSEKLLNEKSQD